MKIVILILSAFYLTACAVKSEEKQTTIIQDVSVIKSAKACTNEGNCK